MKGKVRGRERSKRSWAEGVTKFVHEGDLNCQGSKRLANDRGNGKVISYRRRYLAVNRFE